MDTIRSDELRSAHGSRRRRAPGLQGPSFQRTLRVSRKAKPAPERALEFDSGRGPQPVSTLTFQFQKVRRFDLLTGHRTEKRVFRAEEFENVDDAVGANPSRREKLGPLSFRKRALRLFTPPISKSEKGGGPGVTSMDLERIRPSGLEGLFRNLIYKTQPKREAIEDRRPGNPFATPDSRYETLPM